MANLDMYWNGDQINGAGSWSGAASPKSASDTDVVRQDIPGLSGYGTLDFSLSSSATYTDDDLPEIKLVAIMPPNNGVIVEIATLLTATPTDYTGTVTGGRAFSTNVNLGASSTVAAVARYSLQVQYGGSQNSGRLGPVEFTILARPLGLSLGGAGSNGAGSQLIFSGDSALFGPRLNGTHDIGSTVLTLSATPAEMAQYFVGQHITVGLEQFRITAVDAAGFMITIAAPGLANANVNGPVRAGVMIGDGDTLQLPAVDYKVLSVYLRFQLVNSSSVQPTYSGFGWGGYAMNDDGRVAAWLGYFNNFNYRWDYGQSDPTDVPFLVALLFSTNQVTFNWWLGYYPATHTLMIEPVSAATDTRIPVVTTLKIIGG